MREAIRNLSPRGEFFLIVGICFGYFSISSIITLLRGVREFHMTTPRVLFGIAIEVTVLVVSAWILRIRGFDFGRLGLRFRWPAFLAGIPLIIATLVIYWATYALAAWLYPAVRQMQTPKMIHSASIVVMTLFILLNSLFEEAAVTGYVINSLSEQGAALSITASALIRFVYHLYQGPISSLSILPLGLVFAAVYWKWRNLWPLMTAHTIANLLAVGR
jgi:CAAX protease family protein